MDLDPESRIRYRTRMSVVRDAEVEELREENAQLRAALAAKDETLAAKDDALAELAKRLRLTEQEVAYLRRRFFGRSSEKHAASSVATLFDGLSPVEPPPAETAPDDEASVLTERERKQARRKPTGRRPLPESFPRRETEHPLPEDERACGSCGEPRVRIGEERSEILHFVPAHWEVEVHVRGKYACRCGEGGVVTPPAPARPIPGSYAGPSLLAHVLVSKYDDHLPLYRQAEIFRRAGLDLARSTLCDWIGGVMPLLAPVAGAVRDAVLAQSYVQADETPVLVQEGPEGRPKEGYFWVYRGGGSGEVFFDFRMGRSRDGPSEVLADFEGTLQVDGYAGYDEVVHTNELVVLGCHAHARRKFHEAFESSPREAALALVLWRRLYAIEERGAAMSADERLALRTAESVPALANLKILVDELATDALPASRLGKACAYALAQWPRLTRYATDGAWGIDNNSVERCIRGVAVGRANWIFCGNDEGGRRAAVIYTLIESCKAAAVEPFEYLTDLLTRLPSAAASRIADFTPRNWAAARVR